MCSMPLGNNVRHRVARFEASHWDHELGPTYRHGVVNLNGGFERVWDSYDHVGCG